MLIDVVRWFHVLGATVLLGTGAGIAFFMLMAHRTRDPVLIAHTAHIVVIADWVFTASAVIIQPLSGLWLAHLIGWSLSEGWIVLSMGLYVLTGLFWLPVIQIQKNMRDLARQAVRDGTVLCERYHRLFRIWFACGVPAFLSVITILWLMIARPAF